MLDYIEKVRNKPEPARRAVAAAVLAIAATAIIAVWVSTFSVGSLGPSLEPIKARVFSEDSSPSLDLLLEMARDAGYNN